MPFVAFKVYQVCVDFGVLDLFVSQQPLNMQHVLGSVVFHAGFPVAQSVKVDLFQSWVLQGSELLQEGQRVVDSFRDPPPSPGWGVSEALFLLPAASSLVDGFLE